MSVYVDTIMVHPNAWGPFRRGSCHMFADDLVELHALAARLGLRREWFQAHSVVPHYDLVPSKRAEAVRLGAVEVDRRTAVGIWRRNRKEAPTDG